MSLLVVLIIGGLVGWLAARVAGRDEGIIASMIIGVIGSVIGGVISAALSGGSMASLSFSWVGLFWSFIGALILVIILNAIQYRPHRNV